jgi:hypothetical protein
MPITVGTGPGEYPPVVQYVVNGDPADDLTFNRPTTDLDNRTEAIRNCLDNFPISEVVGLQAALQGAAPLHPNLIELTTLDYGANPEKIFAIDNAGNATLIPNTLQGENNTGSNLGGGSQVFESKLGIDLRFRTLVAGTNITLNQTANEIEIVSTPGEIGQLTKLVKNTTGNPIAPFRVVAWLDDGTVQLADANILALADFCGITLSTINDAEFGLVAKLGNIAGALAGLGAKPGQLVYMSETPGLISLTPPPGINDIPLILGRAEPPNGVATGTADDLWLQPSYLAEGGA